MSNPYPWLILTDDGLYGPSMVDPKTGGMVPQGEMHRRMVIAIEINEGRLVFAEDAPRDTAGEP